MRSVGRTLATESAKQIAFQICVDHIEAYFPLADALPGLKITLCLGFINTPQMLNKLIHWSRTGNWGGKKTVVDAVVAALGAYIHPYMYISTKTTFGTTVTLAIDSHTRLFTNMMSALGYGGLTGKEIERVVRPELYAKLGRKMGMIAAHYQLQTGMDPQQKIEQIKELSRLVGLATTTTLGRAVAKALPWVGVAAVSNAHEKLNREIAALAGPSIRAGGNRANITASIQNWSRQSQKPGQLQLPSGNTTRSLPPSFNVNAYTKKMSQTKIKELERMSNAKFRNFVFPKNSRGSQANINKAFREFSRKFHPNKAGGNTPLRNRFTMMHTRASTVKNTIRPNL